MKPWPIVYLPPVAHKFPELSIKSTWGSSNDRNQCNIYVCGITPYDATHLGHALTYLTFDLINRYQVLRGRSLNFIENVTDVDDPLFERARRDRIYWKDLSDSQVRLFESDMTSLRVLPPKTYLSVSETVNLVIEGIRKLDERKLTYRLDQDLYFDISSHIQSLPISMDEAIKIFQERGGDPDRPGKRHRLDPVLWRESKSDEPSWESPFGLGRPGWHIECSVIAIFSASVNGESEPLLDIQGGGRDLIFPHHFMTKVIAEEISNSTFASEYVHTGMLGYDGEKMSKSKGNLVFVNEILKSGIDPMVLRYALIKLPYSKDSMWESSFLDSADREISKIRSALSKSEVAPTANAIDNMIIALSQNLDVDLALKHLLNWSEETLNGKSGGNVGSISRFIDSALGLAL